MISFAGLRTGFKTLFAEREIFLRSGGRVRFLRIGARVQAAAFSCIALLLIVWATATVAMLFNQVAVARSQAALDARSEAVNAHAGKVSAYRGSIGALSKDLEARQDFMEETIRSHFGAPEDGRAVVGKAAPASRPDADEKTLKKISAAMPEAAPLLRLEQRQRQFAVRLTSAVQLRARKAEAAIRSFGLDPRAMGRRVAMGGPFVPWHGDRDGLSPELKSLSAALARLDSLETSLIAIPSGKPTGTPMLSSSYGYRIDPFNGHAAFHAGLDFPGRYGQPILAAAAGRVSYAGQRQGYGNVVEIDHGNGLMTRYAHLSAFGTRVGAVVARGDQIARMGSTGRSTGTHLHFEVRRNGEAVNPRRFLEVRTDVLQAQQDAKDRFADVGHRG